MQMPFHATIYHIIALLGSLSAMRAHVLAIIVLFICAQSNAAEIHVDPIDGTNTKFVAIMGTLEFNDAEVFRSKTNSISKAVVAFKSDGGNLLAGLQIGEIIRLRNFATFVPDGFRCASACALAWLGGTKRYMGTNARIGFHAAYTDDAGGPNETSVGNALVGAYLTRIGLPYSAVVYITKASPTSMTWLTLSDAESRGIEVATLSLPKDSSPEPSKQPNDSNLTLEERSINFVSGLFFLWSLPNASALPILDGMYSDEVLYFGNIKSKNEVTTEKRKFAQRWPDRKYQLQRDTASVQCESTGPRCDVSGTVEWEVKSLERNSVVRGTAKFSFAVTRVNGYFYIIAEKSEVLKRQSEKLSFEGDFAANILMGVRKSRATYRSGGIAGLISEVKDCWLKLSRELP